MKQILRTALILIFLFNSVLQAQPILEKAQHENSLAENIYVHYNKSSYVAGETIFFKAYIRLGNTFSLYSTSLYAELIDAKGNVILKNVLPVMQGTAVGSFNLQNTLPNGVYTIRLFTQRMYAQGPMYQYEKLIQISNPSSPSTPQTQPERYTTVFLPEGGNLVTDALNVIAFKATDANGNPISVKGVLKNDKGDLLHSFESIHDGMGRFSFTPMAGETYKVQCYYNNGTTMHDVAFPAPVAAAVQLNVISAKEQATIVVNNSKVMGTAYQAANLVAFQDNRLLFSMPIPIDKALTKATLPLVNLKSGIIQITLFSSNYEPLAERIFFVNNEEYKKEIVLKSDVFNLNKRAENTIHFNATDTVISTYSVSVEDADKSLADIQPDNIISSLLLGTQLRGKVNNAPYYLESNDAAHRQALDLLMLTNGWRRYSWKEINNISQSADMNADTAHILIHGRMLQASTKKPIPNMELFTNIQTKDGAWQNFIITSDNEGYFSLGDVVFVDTAKIQFDSKLPKYKGVLLDLKPTPIDFKYTKFQPSLHLATIEPPVISDVIKSTYINANNGSNNAVTLQEVFIKTKKPTTADLVNKLTINTALGSAAKTIDFINNPETFPGSYNVFDYLAFRVPGITVSGTRPNYVVNYRGARSLTGGPIETIMFLNGNQVFTNSVLATIPLNEIALIQVHGASPLASAGGAVAIYTKDPSYFARQLPSSLNSLKLNGYSVTKDFYSPDYSSTTTSVTADNRSAIYWNPYLITNADNTEIKLTFYNSDITKRFKIKLVGMDQDGRFVNVEKIVE